MRKAHVREVATGSKKNYEAAFSWATCRARSCPHVPWLPPALQQGRNMNTYWHIHFVQENMLKFWACSRYKNNLQISTYNNHLRVHVVNKPAKSFMWGNKRSILLWASSIPQWLSGMADIEWQCIISTQAARKRKNYKGSKITPFINKRKGVT